MFKTNFALQRWCCYPANWHPLLYFIFRFCMWLSVRTCFLSTRLYLFYFALALHISACTFGSVGWRFLTCSYWPHQPAHFLLSVVSWLLSHPKIPSTWPHFISFSFLLLFFPSCWNSSPTFAKFFLKGVCWVASVILRNSAETTYVRIC